MKTFRFSVLVMLLGTAFVLTVSSDALAAKKPTKKTAKTKAATKPTTKKATPAATPEKTEEAAPTPSPAATETKPAATDTPPTQSTQKQESGSPTPGGLNSGSLNLDFDLLDKPVQPEGIDMAKAEELQRLAKKRRVMLTIHQAIGFGLLATMTATTVLGTLNYYDKFGGGGYTNQYNLAHLTLSMVSTGLFAVNGILALATPDPYEHPGTWDTARWHRIFMVAATVGMAAQIVLGFVSSLGAYGQLSQRDWALTHLVLGYATYAFIGAGALVYVF